MAYINGKKVITCVLSNEVKDEVNVAVTLNMANGNQVIKPPDDTKTMRRVLVKKPKTLIADNIKKDINIGGVIGTYAGIIPTGTLEITENETYDVTEKASAIVNIPSTSVIEIATSSEMDALLIQANVGKYYKFTGTTDDNYTNGDVYEVVQA